jgi:succinoglycan biosynthesis protein ExoL
LVQVIFFGHDAYDPAIQRRIAALENTGASVQAFTMRRGQAFTTPWRNVDLGATRDAAFAQRFVALARAAPMLSKHRDALRHADVFYARNLDMLMLASWAKSTTGARATLIYECLDIHRFMTQSSPLGAAMRSNERALLKNVSLVVVSSKAFADQYFNRVHPGLAKTMLVENRLPWGFDYGPRPAQAMRQKGPIRIGWFGVLRCRRSLNLLLDLADRFPDDVAMSFRGIPARNDIPDFEAEVAGRANVHFGGRYKWPDDLASTYADVDLVWAGDFHDPSANSRWLMPNRLYEGGYYSTPPFAASDSETGRWIEAQGFGFTLPEPLEQTMPAFISALDRGAIQSARARLVAAPDTLFLQSRDEMAGVLAAAMRAD